MEINLIPKEELLKDKQESLIDIEICKKALSLLPPIETYSGGSVQDRLETNYKIVEKIQKELTRREYGQNQEGK